MVLEPNKFVLQSFCVVKRNLHLQIVRDYKCRLMSMAALRPKIADLPLLIHAISSKLILFSFSSDSFFRFSLESFLSMNSLEGSSINSYSSIMQTYFTLQFHFVYKVFLNFLEFNSLLTSK